MFTQAKNKRDLNWCLYSAPLISNSKAKVWPDQAWFDSLVISDDVDVPSPAHPHRFRLGHRFERILAAWLHAADRFRLLGENLQVQGEQRTIGEFDFLVSPSDDSRSGATEHWEVAVKFYLGTGNGKCLSDWYGPNTEDRLDLKFEHLVNHQLALSRDPAAIALLNSKSLYVTNTLCFMKGRLYHPWHRFTDGEFSVPKEVNVNHEKGWWICFADFLREFEGAPYRYAYLPKSKWLAKEYAADCDLLSFWEMQEFLSSSSIEQATQIGVFGEAAQELSRGFVVTNEWLDRAGRQG